MGLSYRRDRPDVVTSSGLSTIHDCHRRTDRQTCLQQRPATLAFRGSKKFLIFKIRCVSISEKIQQKHRLITRKIIFIVPPVPAGPKSERDNVYLTPPVAPPMHTFLVVTHFFDAHYSYSHSLYVQNVIKGRFFPETVQNGLRLWMKFVKCL